jgi:hypothetical protein
LVKRLVFFGIQILSLGALPFLGSLAAYRGVDPGCHIFPPFFTAYTHTTRQLDHQAMGQYRCKNRQIFSIDINHLLTSP